MNDKNIVPITAGSCDCCGKAGGKAPRRFTLVEQSVRLYSDVTLCSRCASGLQIRASDPILVPSRVRASGVKEIYAGGMIRLIRRNLWNRGMRFSQLHEDEDGVI